LVEQLISTDDMEHGSFLPVHHSTNQLLDQAFPREHWQFWHKATGELVSLSPAGWNDVTSDIF
jgi:hypothetical protein